MMATLIIPGDTRESAAIYIARHLLDEGAHLDIYDPKVTFLSSPSPKKHKRSQVFPYCPHLQITFQVSEHQVRMELAGVSEDPARWENSSLSRLPVCQEWESLEISSFCLKAVHATLDHVLFDRKHISQSWEAGDMSHRPILCSCFRWGDIFVKLIAEKEAQTKTTTTIITKETLQHMRWWSAQNGTSSPASITKGASPKKELKTCQHAVDTMLNAIEKL